MKNFDFENAQYEEMPCNLCGNDKDFKIIATIDRNKLFTRTCLCKKCGLMFISPRMTKEWYDLYYQQEYRNQVAKKKKISEYSLDKLYINAEKFGYALASLISPYLKSGLTIEVGSSVGGVLNGFKKVKSDLEVLGIEPSKSEAEYAARRGVNTTVSLFEDIGDESMPPAANILCLRSLDHLLNPRKFLIWAYKHLVADGILIIAVRSFRHSCRTRGHIVPQIDHTFMFTSETIKLFVTAAGFDVIFFENPEDISFSKIIENKRKGLPANMKLVARRTNRLPFNNFSIPKNIYHKVSSTMNISNIKLHHLLYLSNTYLYKISSKLKLL